MVIVVPKKCLEYLKSQCLLPSEAEITSHKEKTVINDGDNLEFMTLKKTPTYSGLVHFFVR